MLMCDAIQNFELCSSTAILLFISNLPVRSDGPSSVDRTFPVAHYEANNGMTAPGANNPHKGIASTARWAATAGPWFWGASR